MKYPEKEQILAAANTSKAAKACLKKLFPELFLPFIQPSQIYKWGTASDGGSGLVVERPDKDGYMFINFHKNIIYLRFLPVKTTIEALNSKLQNVNPLLLHNCYAGSIKGPYYFKSWVTK